MFGMLTVNACIISIFIWMVIIDGNVRFEQLNRIMTGICYALGVLLTELFGEYVFSVIKEENKISRWLPILLRTTCGVIGALDLVSIFNGMYFSTVNGYHVRGPLFVYNQVFVLVIMIIEMIYVLTGCLGAYVSHLHPWDLAAGRVLAEELGLVVKPIDDDHLNVLSSNLVLVATKQAGQDLLTIAE